MTVEELDEQIIINVDGREYNVMTEEPLQELEKQVTAAFENGSVLALKVSKVYFKTAAGVLLINGATTNSVLLSEGQ